MSVLNCSVVETQCSVTSVRRVGETNKMEQHEASTRHCRHTEKLCKGASLREGAKNKRWTQTNNTDNNIIITLDLHLQLAAYRILPFDIYNHMYKLFIDCIFTSYSTFCNKFIFFAKELLDGCKLHFVALYLCYVQ